MGGNLTFNDNDDVQLKGATDATLIGNTGDSLKVVTTANALPTGASTSANQSSELTLIGAVTETAPATDTASSGLNGRLQRIAQRLTSLLALIPASLGQKTMANSLAVVVASDQTAIPASQSGTWSNRITDGTDTVLVTTNGDQKVVDGVRNGGVYGALSIPTANTPVEAKVGASRLTNRKFLEIYSNNNGLFWGLDNTVTTTSGVPLVNGQVLTFAIDPDSTFQVWLVGSTNSKSVQVVEAP